MNKAVTSTAILGSVVFLLLAGWIGNIVGRSGVKNYMEGRDEGMFDEALMQASNELNKQLPMVVDSGTMLHSTVGGPGKRFTYLYSLTKLSSEDINEQSLREQLEENIVNSTCTNKQMENFVNNGVVVVYQYKGNDGKFIGEITVDTNNCGTD